VISHRVGVILRSRAARGAGGRTLGPPIASTIQSTATTVRPAKPMKISGLYANAAVTSPCSSAPPSRVPPHSGHSQPVMDRNGHGIPWPVTA
jgi:hypothetical protein